ncbi:hypothetical protein FGF66_09245 [Chlorobaculum thiosulfatiphilum]|uniref:Uncharacterized protein n=1 Tax=Chlorobaculum thiosulfatiphilum TaxID=115852 RepID=A0A5C4S4W0_CHLTI|nr:hypothetical protein [Chlorobaculum thiosulfatiphilum]TNJ38345.1 hypothetical protein FGF66_09245 [Chlorobaculum thiosulfatiphilum]
MSWFSGFIGKCMREDSESGLASNRMNFLLYFIVYIAFDHDTVKQAEGSRLRAKLPKSGTLLAASIMELLRQSEWRSIAGQFDGEPCGMNPKPVRKR